MQPNSIFFAIRGDNFDGQEFLGQAIANGASAVVVNRKPKVALKVPILQVTDVRAALGKLAATVRGKLTGAVVAVAGSNGKTSTKRLIDAALSSQLRG